MGYLTTRMMQRRLRSSDLPIREEHTLGGMPLGVPFIRHAQIGPADAVAARDEAAERLRIVALAAHPEAANPRLRRAGFDCSDLRLHHTANAGGNVQHAN